MDDKCTFKGFIHKLRLRTTDKNATPVRGSCRAEQAADCDVCFSGAVSCDMTMMVDGMAVQLGMGMKATVHSSTLVDASLKMEGFKMVDAQISMPKERMDVYNFE